MHKALIFLFYLLIFCVITTQAQKTNEDCFISFKKAFDAISDKNLDFAEHVLDSLDKTALDSNSQTRSKILRSELFRIKQDLPSAKTLFSSIDPKFIADSTILGEYYYQKSKLQKNPQLSKKALWNGLLIGLKNNIGLISLSHYYNGLGFFSLNTKQVDSAIFYYAKAIDTFLADTLSKQNTADLALYYQNMVAPYAMQQDYDMAKKYAHHSINIYSKNNIENSSFQALSYSNLGRIYFITGILDSAEYYYSKAENIRAKLYNNDYKSLGDLYLNIGGFHAIVPNLEKALSYFQRAKYFYEEANITSSNEYHKTNLNIGFTLMRQKKYAEAIPYFMDLTKSKNPYLAGKAALHLAKCYGEYNNQSRANDYYDISIKKLKSLGKYKYDLGLSHLNYGDYLRNKDIRKSITEINKGKTLISEIYGEHHRDNTIANIYLSRTYLKNKDFSEALLYAHEALTHLLNDFTVTDPTKYPDNKLGYTDNLIPTAILLKGRIFYDRYKTLGDYSDLKLAFDAFARGLKMIENTQLNYDQQSNKLLLANRASDDYDQMLEVLLSLYQTTQEEKYLQEIFKYMEKSKASVLLSSIINSEAKIKANIPDTTLQKERFLRSSINGLKKLIYEENQKSEDKNLTRIEEWETSLVTLNEQYEKHTQFIKENHNEYYKLRLKPGTLSLEDVVDHVQDNQVILEYSLLKNKILILAITAEEQKLFISEISEHEVDSLVEGIRNTLVIQDFANFEKIHFEDFINYTYTLYNHLVRPAESMIKNKNIVFIPDGKLGFIPLEVLLKNTTSSTKTEGGMHYKDLDYLLKHNPISYAYSSTLLFSKSKSINPSRHKVFAMAPSYDNIGRIPIDSLFHYRSETTLLLPLPGAKEEVRKINHIFSSDSWTDEKATELNFREHASKYAILHLAMHTVIDDQNPMYSKLVFYQDKKPFEDENSDNLLNTYELFDQQLNAELAVLSACNTGYGKLQQGEGIMSLARGFLYAGVPSIVMTLWPIEDMATADIMENFYTNLSKGMDKDIALQKAKLSFLQKTDQLTSHPHYWASLVNIGPTKPLSFVNRKNHYLPWGILAIGIIAISILLIVKKRK